MPKLLVTYGSRGQERPNDIVFKIYELHFKYLLLCNLILRFFTSSLSKYVTFTMRRGNENCLQRVHFEESFA